MSTLWKYYKIKLNNERDADCMIPVPPGKWKIHKHFSWHTFKQISFPCIEEPTYFLRLLECCYNFQFVLFYLWHFVLSYQTETNGWQRLYKWPFSVRYPRLYHYRCRWQQNSREAHNSFEQKLTFTTTFPGPPSILSYSKDNINWSIFIRTNRCYGLWCSCQDLQH